MTVPKSLDSPLRIGTRGSALALWQAHRVKDLIESATGQTPEIIIIKTQGDQVQNLPLNKLEGKGFFTKELEDALLDGRIDLAVHSMKDLPTQLPEGLQIGAVPERESPADWLLIRPEASNDSGFWGLKKAAIVGTSSNRRSAQLLAYQSDIQISMLRGNVPTRIQKLKDGQYDAILIAGAGIHRLQADLSGLLVRKLDTRQFIPAPAQGALAIECRENDRVVVPVLEQLHNQKLAGIVQSERDFLSFSGGGCHAPVGAWTEETGNRFILHTFLNNRRLAVSGNDLSELPGRAIRLHQLLQNSSNETVFLIRSPEETQELAKLLISTGRRVSSIPGISVVPDESGQTSATAQSLLDQSDGVLYTSRHSVQWVASHLKNFQIKPGIVIGPATFEEAKQAGITDIRLSETGNSDGLQREWSQLLKEGERRIFYPVSSAAETTWTKTSSIRFHVLPVYGICSNTFAPASLKPADKLVLFSASGAETVVPALLELERLPKIITIGPKTSTVIRNAGLPVYYEAPYPSMDGLLEGIIGDSTSFR